MRKMKKKTKISTRAKMAKVEIIRNSFGVLTGVTIDGKKIPCIKSLEVSADAHNSIPVLRLELFSKDISFRLAK